MTKVFSILLILAGLYGISLFAIDHECWHYMYDPITNKCYAIDMEGDGWTSLLKKECRVFIEGSDILILECRDKNTPTIHILFTKTAEKCRNWIDKPVKKMIRI